MDGASSASSVSFAAMIRSSLLRLIAIAFAGSASLATPTAAVAHGYAHSEAAEHAQQHASGTAHEAEHPAASGHEHDEDHAHPRLDPSAFTRVVKDLPAIRTEVVTVTLADVVFRESLDAPEPNESPPERPGTSPPQSRAPPAL